MALYSVFLLASAPPSPSWWTSSPFAGRANLQKAALDFSPSPKTMHYYACFEAENIMTGVEQGRGEDRAKILKRADASLLP